MGETSNFTVHAFTWDILTGNPVAFWMSALLIGFQLLFPYALPKVAVVSACSAGCRFPAGHFHSGIGKFLAVEAEKAVVRRLNVQNM